MLFKRKNQDLVTLINEYDRSFNLTVLSLIKNHQHFISEETEENLKNSLDEVDLNQINALIRTFSFLSYPQREVYYSVNDVDSVLNRYKIIYGDKKEFLDFILNKFRQSGVLADYIFELFFKHQIGDLEKAFSKIAIQFLILDEIQQFHMFLASMNKDNGLKNRLQNEILQRNENLLKFFQKEGTHLNAVTEIFITNRDQKYVL